MNSPSPWNPRRPGRGFYLTSAQLHQRMLDVRCPYCWQGPGDVCRTVSGYVAQFMHAARRDVYFGHRKPVLLIVEEPW